MKQIRLIGGHSDGRDVQWDEHSRYITTPYQMAEGPTGLSYPPKQISIAVDNETYTIESITLPDKSMIHFGVIESMPPTEAMRKLLSNYRP